MKDTYFRILIHPVHRKYLRVAFQGVSYEFLVLPFGLSLSPRVFVKHTDAAVGPLRRSGIHMAMYSNDWFIVASSWQGAEDHKLMVQLAGLGCNMNLEKSVLFPSQVISFIGLYIDCVQARVRLTVERL